MPVTAQFSAARKGFHTKLLEATLTINLDGVVSNADSSNRTSKLIAKDIAELLKRRHALFEVRSACLKQLDTKFNRRK